MLKAKSPDAKPRATEMDLSARKSPIKLGLLSWADPGDTKAWSGTLSFMHQALREQFENVVHLGPITGFGVLRLERVFDKVSRLTSGRRAGLRFRTLSSKLLSGHARRKLERLDLDVILAPAASAEIAYLETPTPICYLSDTSFAQISEYYPAFINLSPRVRQQGELIESRAIRKAAAVVYPSEWAADFACERYGVSREKVQVVPFGANLRHAPAEIDFRHRGPEEPFNLLFLGVSWERKGGPIALEAIEMLRERGYNVKLLVCGCRAPLSHPCIEEVPFVDKSNPADVERLDALMRRSHMVFLPTRAEAFGIAFCEASAYGLPSLTTATGGTTSVVKDGVNGFALPPTAGAASYADVIGRIIDSPAEYERLCLTSRERYERELNWNSWAAQLRTILESLGGSSAADPGSGARLATGARDRLTVVDR